ncbi:unnamed protein product [Lepeophtheirus salmonis]|uniref:(salmon louse) hypothetical protein n=1 Tax=Lepeophtheirus salmonis TaxID=72036 RepID=A0A7R8CJS3_LEPSM|nr:unnamed protein product [Lepeophtheirus salmonis]CAF2838958.1 unnamed protein product [Lepeophtheirus salmonis]
MATLDLVPVDGKTSFSGIPSAEFLEDVNTHMKGESSAEAKLEVLDENLRKYKFMESNLVTRRKRLKSQIPDIASSLVLIKELRAKNESKEETETRFLRDQMTITEVTIARLYNWDVKRRQEQKK